MRITPNIRIIYRTFSVIHASPTRYYSFTSKQLTYILQHPIHIANIFLQAKVLKVLSICRASGRWVTICPLLLPLCRCGYLREGPLSRRRGERQSLKGDRTNEGVGAGGRVFYCLYGVR